MYKNCFLLYFVIFSSIFAPIIGKQTTSDHTITVFVHGTFPVRKILQYSPGRSLIYCPQGLSLAKNLPKNYHFYKLAQGCVHNNPKLYSFDQFYIFGWKSEHVYHHTRMQAACDLVKELQLLVDNYYLEHSIVPRIRLIGFSHGGNVVLNTAHYLPLRVNHTKVDVEAWLFGTPVQQDNKDYVNSENFTKVYSFYSESDWIQRMDPQGLRNKKHRKNNFWSDRMFDVTDRCVQIKLTINGQAISHTYYRCIFKHFAKIQELVKQQAYDLDNKTLAINLEI